MNEVGNRQYAVGNQSEDKVGSMQFAVCKQSAINNPKSTIQYFAVQTSHFALFQFEICNLQSEILSIRNKKLMSWTLK